MSEWVWPGSWVQGLSAYESLSRGCAGSQESDQVLSGSKAERPGMGGRAWERVVNQAAQNVSHPCPGNLEGTAEAVDDFFIFLKTQSGASSAAGISRMLDEC